MTDENSDDDQDRPRHSLLAVIGSVLAAGFGVQSSRNRARDFQHGRLGLFVVVGLLGTGLFIGILLTIVALVVRSAGG